MLTSCEHLITPMFAGIGWSTAILLKHPTPSNYIAGRPKAGHLLWYFSDLEVVCCYLLFFLLYIFMK